MNWLPALACYHELLAMHRLLTTMLTFVVPMLQYIFGDSNNRSEGRDPKTAVACMVLA